MNSGGSREVIGVVSLGVPRKVPRSWAKAPHLVGLQTLPPDRLITGATVDSITLILDLRGALSSVRLPKGTYEARRGSVHLTRGQGMSESWYWLAGGG
jgi:hypothetical protein